MTAQPVCPDSSLKTRLSSQAFATALRLSFALFVRDASHSFSRYVRDSRQVSPRNRVIVARDTRQP